MIHRRSFKIHHVSSSYGPCNLSSWSPNTELSCKVSLLYQTLPIHWLNVLLSSFGALFHYRAGNMLDAFVIWVLSKTWTFRISNWVECLVFQPHLGKQAVARWYLPPDVDYRLSLLPKNCKGLVLWVIEAKVNILHLVNHTFHVVNQIA